MAIREDNVRRTMNELWPYGVGVSHTGCLMLAIRFGRRGCMECRLEDAMGVVQYLPKVSRVCEWNMERENGFRCISKIKYTSISYKVAALH